MEKERAKEREGRGRERHTQTSSVLRMRNGKFICLGEPRSESICSSALGMLKYTILFCEINRPRELDYTLLMQLRHTTTESSVRQRQRQRETN